MLTLVSIATYVSIAIMKKRLNLKHSLYEILRALDLNMFEMTTIETLLERDRYTTLIGLIKEEGEKRNLPIKSLSEATQLITLLAMLGAGNGITLLPSSMAQTN